MLELDFPIGVVKLLLEHKVQPRSSTIQLDSILILGYSQMCPSIINVIITGIGYNNNMHFFLLTWPILQ